LSAQLIEARHFLVDGTWVWLANDRSKRRPIGNAI